MDIEVSIKLRRDSYNSNPGKIRLENYNNGGVMFTIEDRIFVVDADDLRKAVAIVTEE